MDKAEFDELIAEARRSYDALLRQYQNKQREVSELDREVKRLTQERDRINAQIRAVKERLGV
jgi:chromosome segregation ATPase